MRSFSSLLEVAKKDKAFTGTLLCIDPGHTTGMAVFKEGKLSNAFETPIDAGEDNKVGGLRIWQVFDSVNPEMVIIEDYRIYGHKAQSHSWNALYTPKLIGYIEAICQYRGIPYYMQMASCKQFADNRKLKEWDFYRKGLSHGTDAIRHGCYWLLFGKGLY